MYHHTWSNFMYHVELFHAVSESYLLLNSSGLTCGLTWSNFMHHHNIILPGDFSCINLEHFHVSPYLEQFHVSPGAIPCCL
jgi:hypothetical protein